MAHKWYIIQAHSNFEKRVQESLMAEAEQKGLSHLFEEILVPTEHIVEIRRGRKVESDRKYFPGYVLVKMDMTDEAYHWSRIHRKFLVFWGRPISLCRLVKLR